MTAITAFKFGENLTNYTEIHIDPEYPLREKCKIEIRTQYEEFN